MPPSPQPLLYSLPLLPSRTRIVDEGEASYFSSVLSSLASSPRPGCHPLPVTRSCLPSLLSGKYVVAHKTDGVRYFLLLTLRPGRGREPIALMVNRAGHMYEVSVGGPRSYFEEGSLYDGELVWDGGGCTSLSYLVFDVFVAAGKDWSRSPYSSRLQTIHDTLYRSWSDGQHPLPEWDSAGSSASLEQRLDEEGRIVSCQTSPFALSLLPKRCVPFSSLPTLWRERETSPYRMDGLVFTSISEPIRHGPSRCILKWKLHQTIDLSVTTSTPPTSSPPFFHLLLVDRGRLLPAEEAVGRRLLVRENEVLSVETPPPPESSSPSHHVYEFAVREERGEQGEGGGGSPLPLFLVPLRRRTDKATPNSLRTVLSTLSLVGEGVVSLSDLVVSESPTTKKQRRYP
jgi:hypothetical protein